VLRVIIEKFLHVYNLFLGRTIKPRTMVIFSFYIREYTFEKPPFEGYFSKVQRILFEGSTDTKIIISVANGISSNINVSF
jgi:hypothetical protein